MEVDECRKQQPFEIIPSGGNPDGQETEESGGGLDQDENDEDVVMDMDSEVISY